MQASQAVCASCRRQLIGAARQRTTAALLPLPQLQARAGFRSAAADQSKSDHSMLGSIIPSLDDLDDVQRQQPPSGLDDVVPFPPRERRPYRRPLSNPNRNASLRIFHKVIEEQGQQAAGAQTAPKDLPPEIVEFNSNLAKLRPMMKEKSIEECLIFYLTEVWPRAPFQGNNRLLKQRGVTLMAAVATAKLADIENPNLPTIAELTEYFWELDGLSPTKWTDMLMGLVQIIISMSSARSDYPSDDAHRQALARKAELLDDLVESWIKFQRYRLPVNEDALQTSAQAEFRLARLDPYSLRTYATHGDLLGALEMLFGRFAKQPRQVPAVALATFVLLSDPKHSTPEIRRKAEPLLTPLSQILAVVEVRKPALYAMLGPSSGVLLYVSQNLDNMISEIRTSTLPELTPAPLPRRAPTSPPASRSRPVSMPTSTSTAAGATAAASDPAPQPAPQPVPKSAQVAQEKIARQVPVVPYMDVRAIHRQLMHALNLGDVKFIEDVFQDFWSRAMKKPGLLQYNAELIDDFIMAFTAVRRPQRAVDVWTAMEVEGIVPTLKTWTAMIDGCKKANNPTGLENVWKKLVATGLQLDSVVWTARIVGLMKCRQPEAALRALREMQLLSKEPGGVPLDITAVNAAVSGLVRLNSLSAAKDVLAWASQYGIEPDTVTYNSLLSPLVQRGEAEQVHELLKTMIQHGVQPDSATWTILLDGLMSSLNGASTPAEQRACIESLFSEMENVGLQANMETFARMVYLILRPETPFPEQQTHHHTQGAVAAILDHIRSKRLKPSPHIHTMLIDYYFSRSPPAYDDVRDLLIGFGFDVDVQEGSAIHDQPSHLDKVLLERLIRGYALTGSVGHAFHLFKRCQGLAGSSITLDALEDLVRSLVDAGMMAQAKQVVDAVRLYRSANYAEAMQSTPNTLMVFGTGREHQQSRSAARYWKHGFWAFALDRGLLTRADWERLQLTSPTSPVGLGDEVQIGV